MIVCSIWLLQTILYLGAPFLLCGLGLLAWSVCESLRAIGESFGGLRERS